MRVSMVSLLTTTAAVAVYCFVLTHPIQSEDRVTEVPARAIVAVVAFIAVLKKGRAKATWAGFAGGGVLYMLLATHYPPANGIAFHAEWLLMGFVGAVTGWVAVRRL